MKVPLPPCQRVLSLSLHSAHCTMAAASLTTSKTTSPTSRLETFLLCSQDLLAARNLGF